MSIQPEVWNVGLVLFNGVTSLDFQGPMELFGFLVHDGARKAMGSKVAFSFDYLATSRDPITPTVSPQILPSKTFKEALAEGKQYDIILIPGGKSTFCTSLAVLKEIVT